MLNPRLTEQSAFCPKLIQNWLALYRVEVLTDSNCFIRKVGTNYTQIVHRFRLRPIKPQYQVTDINDILYENFQTDPTLGYFRGEQDFFDNGLPSLLESDPTVPDKKTPNFDSPVRVSISFGVQPQQPPAAEETVDQPEVAPEMEEPLTIPQAQRLEQPRRILTPPPYLTAQLPESSEESDEYVQFTTAPRRSTRIQEQQTNRLSERLLEVAGQQLQKTRSAKRTNQGQSVEARNFVDPLNNRRRQRQQKQFVLKTRSNTRRNVQKTKYNRHERNPSSSENLQSVNSRRRSFWNFL